MLGWLLTGVELAWRELALFAAAGFLLLGVSDLAVDLIWIVRMLWRRAFVYTRFERASASTLRAAARPGLLAVFIPAWQEAAVIAPMLRHALNTFGHEDYRLYVGAYPNDAGTIAAVRTVADVRIRLVVNARSGPTTKADNLNSIWRALIGDELADGRPAKAVVLHDAEDFVHAPELAIFDSLIERFDLIQLPVLPIIDPRLGWWNRAIASHYADEFVESHGKELVVREAIGASLPSAGVGCAFSRESLGRLAEGRDGPFDADCLTEDYELGLHLRSIGGRGAFVRLRHAPRRRLVATEEYFPSTMDGAVRQKSRWIVGIALSGWDRLGWEGGIAEGWMRLRDRQSVLAALFLASGYAAWILFTLLALASILCGLALRPISSGLALLFWANGLLLCWRLVLRFGFVAASYGWAEGLRAVPRVLVSNLVAMMAARKAMFDYLRTRRTGETRWEKTAHAFPTIAE